jgi:3-methyladenine DNA glycosylase AlkD
MKKYIKGLFEYVGLKKPLRSELETPFLQACRALKPEEIFEKTQLLWQLPEREFQYTALVLMRKNRVWKNRDFLPLLEKLLVSKSWWDTVDALAAALAGPYFLAHPDLRNKTIATWRKSDNLWLNRSTLIFQLTYKEKTDVPLLYDIVRQFSHEKEFFIKKAVGWSLRQLSYIYPKEVVQFCETEFLQPLSQREALKALKRKGHTPLI